MAKEEVASVILGVGVVVVAGEAATAAAAMLAPVAGVAEGEMAAGETMVVFGVVAEGALALVVAMGATAGVLALVVARRATAGPAQAPPCSWLRLRAPSSSTRRGSDSKRRRQRQPVAPARSGKSAKRSEPCFRQRPVITSWPPTPDTTLMLSRASWPRPGARSGRCQSARCLA